MDLDQAPMELAGSAMSIMRRSSDLRAQMAGKAMLAPVPPSEEFIGSQVTMVARPLRVTTRYLFSLSDWLLTALSIAVNSGICIATYADWP